MRRKMNGASHADNKYTRFAPAVRLSVLTAAEDAASDVSSVL